MNIDNRVNGKTKLLGIIGNPIEHSISPQLHNTMTEKLDLNYIYIPFKVEDNSLEKAVNGLKALGFEGFNVTIPYKSAIMDFLDEISDEALLMGAVNTVKIAEGRLYGYNTDADGFARSFKEEAGEGFEGKNIVIIGAGGAARAIAVKIAFEGARHISIVNRTISRAQDICDIINSRIDNIAECCSSEYENMELVFNRGDIIVNTTSIGMYPDINSSPVGDNIIFSQKQIIYDAIYNPAKTKFMQDAEKCGCKVVNGLGMLLYQGIYAYEIWTGLNLDEKIVNDVLSALRNILGK